MALPADLMSAFGSPVSELVRQRYSCRSYDGLPIGGDAAAALQAFARDIDSGPLGSRLRFELVLASTEEPGALRGLGTYGFVRGHGGFVIGAVANGAASLEDFGHAMEAIVLRATDLGMGTCWLGGSFTRGGFSRRLDLKDGESMPAVATIGRPLAGARAQDRLRRWAGSDARLPWEDLFHRSGFEEPLTAEHAGAYSDPLAAVRLAPSSHNTQPWRVVREGDRFHFYLRRSRGYGPGSLPQRLLGLVDLQRVDVGIAMCHFELVARQLGLSGRWTTDEPDLPGAVDTLEFVASWVDTDR